MVILQETKLYWNNIFDMFPIYWKGCDFMARGNLGGLVVLYNLC